MVRRTVNMPDRLDERVELAREEGESYSAAVTRLLEAGMREEEAAEPAAWMGSGEGPEDLGRRAEDYLRRPVQPE